MQSPTVFDPDPVIQLDQVAVRYRIPAEPVLSLKEHVIRLVQRRVSYRDVWALNKISLEVMRGEVLGIFGPNGAGKSTLLKVVARVLQPTRGRVRTVGRIAPLLDLGAGFEFELTGRENIFLYGTMLGYSRADLKRRLAAIMDFAGLHDFIDAPLRTYSNGMVLRLGFAIAAQARPDILLVDEVLAVGDPAFQEKCVARLRTFVEQGTTVLLVSHAPESVLDLCHRAVYLENGRIVAYGQPPVVLPHLHVDRVDRETSKHA